MIEYKHKESRGRWIIWPGPDFVVRLATFDLHLIRVNGVVFSSWTAEFNSAYDKELMWRNLQ